MPKGARRLSDFRQSKGQGIRAVNDLAKAKPFLKWVGGKRQLLPEIRAVMPQSFQRYFEPFMGGAALFFDTQPTQAHLSDINDELVNCYLCVRDMPEALIEALGQHHYDKDYYYHIRNLDRDKEAFAALSPIIRAARLMFLNRAGFNGMYRVNSKGAFNVPFGRYTNPTIVNEPLIMAASRALALTQISCASYLHVEEVAQAGDFVYFDPPYMPLSPTAHFTRYAKDDFAYEDQVRLAKTCQILHDKGVRFVASNAYHEDIKGLYQGFEIKEIKARRAINARADGRKPVSEALIFNRV